MSKLVHALKRMKGMVWAIWFAIFREHVLLRASSLTITSLLNVVPLMVVVFSVFSIFPFFEKISLTLQGFIFQNFIPSSGQVLQGYLQTFEAQAHQLPTVAFLFLFLTVGILMYNIEGHLNVLFRVTKPRRLSEAILLYWGMLTLAPIFLGLSVVFSSYLMSLEFLSTGVLVGAQKLLVLLPFASAFLSFWFLYLTVPNCDLSMKHAAIGAGVATVLFELAKFFFGLYLKFFPTYALIYGAVAVIPIFIIWVYVSWVIFLLGAMVASRLRRHHLETQSLDFFKSA